MSNKYPHDFNDLVKSIPISEVILEYINLNKRGGNWVALCPFHSDKKTPSLVVNDTKGMFKCFGCGIGGNSIKFISIYKNIGYVEAAHTLADKLGITLQSKNTNPIFSILSAINQIFQDRLATDKTDFLHKRHITQLEVKKFGIGLCSSNDDKLQTMLRKYSNDLERIKFINKNGNCSFIRRITFPIKSLAGDVIGFTARAIYENDTYAKYINSHNSAIFNKSKDLYNINNISNGAPVIITEGCMDVISLSKIGYQAVAALGSSMTAEAFNKLVHINKKIVICMDGDQTGINASIKLAETALINLQEYLDISVATLPKGTDADTMVNKDPESIKKAISNAMPIFQYLIKQYSDGVDLNDFTSRASIKKRICNIAKNMVNSNLREELYTDISALFSKNKASYLNQLQKHPQQPLIQHNSIWYSEVIIILSAILNNEITGHVVEYLADTKLTAIKYSDLSDIIEIALHGVHVSQNTLFDLLSKRTSLAKAKSFLQAIKCASPSPCVPNRNNAIQNWMWHYRAVHDANIKDSIDNLKSNYAKTGNLNILNQIRLLQKEINRN